MLKAVHLLANHIGAFADAKTEQICRLQKLRPYLAKACPMEVFMRHGLNRLPALKYLR